VNQEPTNAEKIRLLPWSIAFNAANAVWFYLTFFGSAFVLFLSQLGVSKTEIGSLLSLLPFFGLTALFSAPAVARWGYKRTFLATYSGRMLITAFLLFTPWVASQFGARATTLYVTGVVIIFALTRSVSLTALLPWSQEYVPNTVRGKYSALANVFTSIAGFLAVTVGGYVLGSSPDLANFMILFAIGLAFGLLAIWFITFIPGGAPSRDAGTESASYHQLVDTARDTNFLRYLTGIGLITIVAGPLVSFLPLFLEEQGGINPGTVLWLQNGVMLGGLMSGYLWGWAADRYGSKPVMLWGVALRVIVPIFWMLLPRQSAGTLYVALGISLLQGWADLGWSVG
jgi:MFS family permease